MLRWLKNLLAGSPQAERTVADHLDALETRLDVLQAKVDRFPALWAQLETDMTGLSDKLSRQLKRIRSRAAGNGAAAEDDDDDENPIPPQWR